LNTLKKLALPIVVLALLTGIYIIKVETWQLKHQAKALERQIEKEQRAIVLLRAELAYLTRPERIEKLAKKYLKMRPARPDQIIVLKK
jgi:cell division protein FtsL